MFCRTSPSDLRGLPDAFAQTPTWNGSTAWHQPREAS
jgi:hypothetical protein